MTLSDLEWLSKIFSDTKRRAVSLRQLSFLLFIETLACDTRLPYAYTSCLIKMTAVSMSLVADDVSMSRDVHLLLHELETYSYEAVREWCFRQAFKFILA